MELDPKQKTLYQRQLKDYQKHLLPELRRNGLNDGGRFQVLTALLRLRQIACAPELAGHKGPAAKPDLLVEKLVEDIAEGHRALVFSSFTSLLDLVEKRLRKERVEFLRMDGSTPVRERTRLVERFQGGLGEPVFLVSLKAGGAGVNLTAADYVFLLDPWWNLAVEEQAAARAHRIGQTDPVTIYRLVAKDTIEERVLALSRGKAARPRWRAHCSMRARPAARPSPWKSCRNCWGERCRTASGANRWLGTNGAPPTVGARSGRYSPPMPDCRGGPQLAPKVPCRNVNTEQSASSLRRSANGASLQCRLIVNTTKVAAG